MKLSPDDPKLTAYALGELDAAERAAVESALTDSPECRAVVEEIRATAGLLTNELAAEPCPEPARAQRAVLETPPAAKGVPFPWRRVWRTAAISAAAACVVGVFVWFATRDTESVKLRMAKANAFEAKPKRPIYGVAPAATGVNGAGDSGGQTGSAPAPNGFTAALHSGQPPGASAENRVAVTLNNATHAFSDAADLALLSPPGTSVPNQVQSATLTENGRLLFESGKYDLAESQLRQALKMNPDNAGADYYLKHTLDKKFATAANNRELEERKKIVTIKTSWADSSTMDHGKNPFKLQDRPAPPAPADLRSAAVGPEQAIPQPGNGGGVYSVNAVGNSPGYTFRNESKSADPRLRVWGGEGRSGLDHSGVAHAEFTPDGRRIITASDDKTVRIWDAQTGQPITHPITAYASEAGIKLESTACSDKEKILAVIDALEAGGSTNGGEGIQQAYATARRNFVKNGVNRVILCTDGDFNVGLTDQNALVALVKENAATGVFLTTLGVGTANYKDALMQRLSDRANGNYHYLDTLEEARKVLIEQMNATLVTIAKDMKIQVEFNPAQVSAYRLIGYEKRMLRTQDFNNDKKDAGEIGAGHTVTAFYEIIPAGAADVRPVVDKLKYQAAVAPASYSEKGEHSKELLTLKLRYKQPDGDTSKLLEFSHTDSGGNYGRASGDFKFASAVAAFGMILRESEHKGSATIDTVLELAGEGKGADEGGWRAEFINMVKKAKALGSRTAPKEF